MNRDQIEGGLRDATGKLQQGVAMAIGDARLRGGGAARELRGKAQTAYGDARETAEQVADQAYGIGSEIADRARDGYEQASRRVVHGAATVSRNVEGHPWESLLVAGVAGFLLGLLSARVG